MVTKSNWCELQTEIYNLRHATKIVASLLEDASLVGGGAEADVLLYAAYHANERAEAAVGLLEGRAAA